ncbi:WD40 repeat-like protein [Punctularia strigosozonata HHB-11173 SS5]|uniref:WD40 repeat-like protein n=1 Tax=Punctularia strigosozonata (strain HHB-11173) TaxID=741275 RepID=UPI0004417B1B|nr:WD40 repeat-like protein [Punctularia strigosozonata HHB-11173 SS5]EIN13833.1 WD40 repeat-like protein [Punctularia strigosozonata HHB-11173 SS5]
MADDDLYEITFEDEGEDGDDDDIVVDDEELAGLFEEAETHRQAGSQPTHSVVDAEDHTTRVQVPLSTLARLFGITSSTLNEEDEDEDDDEYYAQPTTPPQPSWTQPHREPQEAGVRLLGSGDFGRVGPKLRSRQRNQRNVSRELEDRRVRLRPSPREVYAQELVPNSNGVAVASYEANIYCGQYSADSSFYYTCCQDFRLHVYDTASILSQHLPNHGPQFRRRGSEYELDPGHQTRMKVIKTIQGHAGRWTITDSHLSPDNERMIYSSITPVVYMVNTRDSSPIQTPINFADSRSRAVDWTWEDRVAIWSCRFSADGNEIVAGGTGKIFVYDLLADRRSVKINAHDDDVNSCCWADTASGNVLISASDDTFLKVWDRRSLGSSQRPAGVLVGHTEGITNVAPKGDGRYIISNGKDQALRLWDLRKMRSSAEFDRMPQKSYGCKNYDYRYGYYPNPRFPAHPNDCSVMTYRGHAVLRTLIRCHFSPAETTGSQYIYSGSSDGLVHIWSLDGRIVQILDRSKTMPMSFDPSGPEYPMGGRRNQATCVRDVSWHTREPIILSAGWEGRMGGSIVAQHEWKGMSKTQLMSRNGLEDWVTRTRDEAAERQARRRMPGGRLLDSDEESE